MTHRYLPLFALPLAAAIALSIPKWTAGMNEEGVLRGTILAVPSAPPPPPPPPQPPAPPEAPKPVTPQRIRVGSQVQAARTCNSALDLWYRNSFGIANVTYSKDVAPILNSRCAECHRPGEIAPMPLLTYKQVRPWAAAIREKVSSRAMPPWFAHPKYGQFKNDRRLSSVLWSPRIQAFSSVAPRRVKGKRAGFKTSAARSRGRNRGRRRKRPRSRQR